MGEDIDIGLGLEDCLAIVTGAGGQIGGVIVKALLAARCFVAGFDIDETKFTFQHKNLIWRQVDVTNEADLEKAFNFAQDNFSQVAAICIAAAGLDLSFINHPRSIIDLSVEQFRQTLEVNTTGSFLTSKIWLKNLEAYGTKDTRNASLILFGKLPALMMLTSQLHAFVSFSLIRNLFHFQSLRSEMTGSEAGILGVPGNPDYSASKAAIQYGIVKSLAPDAAKIFLRARVNAVAPGPVDTPQFRKECAEASNSQVEWREAQATVAQKKAVSMESVAKICLMLASESFSSSITGQVIPIDGGKSGRLFWNSDGSSMW